jgi:hypothetical protein
MCISDTIAPLLIKLSGAVSHLLKTLRKHIADWVLKIQYAYPDDTLKQIQLA